MTRALLLVAAAVLGGAPQLAAAAAPSRQTAPPAGQAAPLAGQVPTSAQSCPPPEPDPARAPAADSPPLAVAPVRLDASRIELHQVDLLRSNKIVSVRTRQGSKRVLRFVAGAVDVTDLRQTTAPGGAASLTLSTPAGNRSRLGGPVILYVEKLCGTLAVGPLGVGFGVPGALLPPISAASPPPAVLPEVTFTGATTYVAGLSSAQLDLPGVQLSADAG
ncbi:MAG: hypothetical protein ACRDR6_16275 [Pseudonocardiaceae bacterium]